MTDRKWTPRLESFGIRNPQNLISKDFMEHVLINRQKLDFALQGDENAAKFLLSKPLFVIKYPKSDYNESFEYNDMYKLIKKGNVLFFEIHNQTEDTVCLKKIKLLKKKYKNLQKPYATNLEEIIGIFAGHGNSESLNYSDDGDDESEMSVEDIGEFDTFSGVFSQIYLKSCSTGSGGVNGINLATFTQYAFKPKNGVTAPMIDSSSKLMFDDDGNFIEVKYETKKILHVGGYS
jgi:hypothetical protein